MSHTDPAAQAVEGLNVNVTTPTDPPAAPAATAPESFSQEQLFAAIEKAREEERARLSPTSDAQQKMAEELAALRTQTEQFTAAETARQKEAEEAAAKLEAEAKAKAEEEMSAKDLLLQKEQEWQARFAQVQEDAARKEALLQKEREHAEVVDYIRAQVDANRENIAPQFLGYVTGATKEEVDASIATAIANTASILEEVRQAQVSQRAAVPGVSPTAGNVGPLEQQDSTRTFTAEEIAAMPVNSPQYQELRRAAGIAGAGRGRGLFQ